jgi:hypothetical protein
MAAPLRARDARSEPLVPAWPGEPAAQVELRCLAVVEGQRRRGVRAAGDRLRSSVGR